MYIVKFSCRFVLLFLLLSGQVFAATAIVWKETHLPMSEAGSQGLEALLVWPDDGNKHPLVLISHGAPRDQSKRPSMTALAFLPIAKEFARRGFSVAVVLRRGYGTSGGGYAEGYGTCKATNYHHSALMSAQDLQAAIQDLSSYSQFDTNKIIAVGISAGGFATVALTAINPPNGLVAAINFAGGRGSLASDQICKPDQLINEFGELGKTSRVPMLWVYAQNDHFFNPSLAKQFYNAFTQNGGNATFIQAEPYEDDGHFLFSSEGIPVWTPIVDQFLKKQHLVLVGDLLPLNSALTVPNYLTGDAKRDFGKYILNAPHKAFAYATNGAYGWRYGEKTIDSAKSKALATCEDYSEGEDCKIIAVDDQLM